MDLLEPPFDGEGERPLQVSQITAQVKSLLEGSLSPCWVAGEISDYTHHASGHRYFTLKDERSQLSCVLFKWQGQRLSFEPEPGMMVLAHGHVSVYERGGRYQFYVAQLQPGGAGERALAFEQLKHRLEAEGLFAEERKRPLPPFPREIGVVTSATGAAIRDIIHVLGRRAPGVRIVLRPARVQGPGAAGEIARAIADLNEYGRSDVLIVGRGGGAPEDLWPFNEEGVARAIYHSQTPVIAAVGHEIDYTIADYVADYRAPTPSAAAEVVVQEQGALRRRLGELRRRLGAGVDERLEHCRQRLANNNSRRLFLHLRRQVEQSSQYADERRQALAAALDGYLGERLGTLRTAALRLQALSPLAHLARGFAFCTRAADGRPVRHSKDLQPGDTLALRFHRGSALCRVEEIDYE